MPKCGNILDDAELTRLAERVAAIGRVIDGQCPRAHREAISAKFRTFELEAIAARRLAKAIDRLREVKQHQHDQYRGRRDWMLMGWPTDDHGAPDHGET